MKSTTAKPFSKGILLAGGSGTRLRPLTTVVSKQLLPVYDKPLVYYPLSTLLLAGIRSVLVITTPHDQAAFQKLLGDGSQWGIELRYAVQPQPGGLAQGLLIGREFIAGDNVVLVLGDNLFDGEGLPEMLQRAGGRTSGATIFASRVPDPQQYGVVELDTAGHPLTIVEKPPAPKSNWAVTGLYYYDNRAVEIAAQLAPSPRGELEITDVNRAYLARGELTVECFPSNFAWFDTGTPDALLRAANYVQAAQQQGRKVGCPQEIAQRQGFMDES